MPTDTPPDFPLLRACSMSLLLCFDSLMHTRSVTATARQMNKSQPAISRDLARLRALLKDPIFVVIRKHLVPTERALSLHAQMRGALAGLEQALGAGQPFSPGELSGVINIGAAAHTELLLAAPLTTVLQREAPRLTVRFLPVHGDFSPDDLDSGRMDLAIGLFHSLPARFPSKVLFRDERVCVVSSRHPLSRRRQLTLNDLQRMKWLAFSHMYGKETNFDRALQGSGHAMRFSAYVSSFGVAPYFLMETDYGTTMPRVIAEKHLPYFDLKLLRLPPVLREARVVMVWSAQNDNCRLNQWLRATIDDLASRLIPAGRAAGAA
ncbi:LysR family transcriptional regulator [Candidimonas humi]|uniref:LysR family transcriptional regulator n=1 Tax=Candidimonas humi TaxID=683355 RepID=A0ABV8P5H5_9BURK|nr:LysR family transcriptional regulator [Candidimonas humi]MBV6307157.1 LysR family transcriptional regulator [Candidimonas humi]